MALERRQAGAGIPLTGLIIVPDFLDSSMPGQFFSRSVFLALLLLTLPIAGSSPQTDVTPPDVATATTQPAVGGGEPTPADDPCRELVVEAGRTGAPREQCQALLDSARCLLCRGCAPLLSAELIGGSTSHAELSLIASRGLQQLDLAAGLLPGIGANDKEIAQIEDCIELFHGFAAVFAALAEESGSEASRKALMDACIGLAMYMDDTRQGIVESAGLWQAVAYRRAGRPDRALQVLRPALATPSSRRIGFWSRVERCRALGDQKDFAAALALCLRLSSRVDAWFEEEDAATRRQVADTLRWLRIALLLDWAKNLRAAGADDEAAEAEADAQLLRGSDAYPPSADRWLLLAETIAECPECPLPEPRPASKPTSSP